MTKDGTILLVEDNADDVFFMERAVKAAQLENPLRVVMDGDKAIEYLSGAGEFADRSAHPLPCSMLLDLKLPGKDGHQVLAWVKQNPELSKVVVIALTTSREPKDIAEAYRLGVNAYLVKPTSPTELVEMMKAFKGFWIRHNVVE